LKKNLPVDLTPYERDVHTIASILIAVFMVLPKDVNSDTISLVYPCINDEYTAKYGAYTWVSGPSTELNEKKSLTLSQKRK